MIDRHQHDVKKNDVILTFLRICGVAEVDQGAVGRTQPAGPDLVGQPLKVDRSVLA